MPVIARQILERVQKESSVRADELPWPAATVRKARTILERLMLVSTRSVHTASGRHQAELCRWQTEPFVRRFSAAARRIRGEDALDDLLCACLTSAVLAPERAVWSWFAEAKERLARLAESGKVCVSGAPHHLVWLRSLAESTMI